MVTSNRSILGLGISRQIGQQSGRVNRVFEQLSSAKRITTFQVDAAGGAISARLESAFRGLNAQITNDQTQMNRLATEEAGMAGITEELQSIRELQVQAQNSALAPQDVNALQDEVNQRVQNIRDLTQNTQFAGNPVIEVASGSQLAGILESGVDVTAAPAAVDTAINEVTTERSEIGTEMNVLSSRINDRQTAMENTVASYSRISDMDMAQGATELLNSQAVQQMAVSSLRNLFVFNRQNAFRLLDAL